jgi:hypothetical protein
LKPVTTYSVCVCEWEALQYAKNSSIVERLARLIKRLKFVLSPRQAPPSPIVLQLLGIYSIPMASLFHYTALYAPTKHDVDYTA